MSQVYKVICIVQIFNELEKGNLKRFFKYIKPLVDGVVVYDDCSTDGSYEYSLTKTKYVIRGRRNDFSGEIGHRQQALDLALTLNPDFILWLDADEVLNIESKSEIQKVCEDMITKNLDGYDLHEINLWRSSTWARTDSLFNDGWFTRIWRVKETMSFKIEYGLHQRAVPQEITKIERTSKISVLHYGFSSDLSIARKYILYKKHGQRGYIMLDRLINEDKLTLKHVRSTMFPKGLYKEAELAPIARSFTAALNMVEIYREKILRPKYSIVCLIYKDIKWLNFVYKQVIKHTNLNDCEFYFVANEATNEVKEYLKRQHISHYIFNDDKKSKNEWYINNVYRAWNYAASKARGDFLVFINSDMAFADDWLDKLIAGYDGNNCVTSRLVESGKLPSGLYGISKSFGRTYSSYHENAFLRYAKSIAKQDLHTSGLFMPLLIRKKHFDRVGGYPEGNIRPNSNIFSPKIAKLGQSCVSGDVVLMEKLSTIGIEHKTAFSSLVYHFQMGEMSSKPATRKKPGYSVAICNDIVTGTMGEKVLWDHLLTLPGTVGVDTRVTGSQDYEINARKYIRKKYREVTVIIQNASYIKRIDRTRYTIVLLQDNLRRMGLQNQIQETNLHFADKIVTNSIQCMIDYPEYDMEHIPIGVDQKLFRPMNKNRMRTKHNLPYKKIGIFVGAFNKVKGFDEVSKIIKKRNDIFWILVTKLDEDYQADNVRVYRRVRQELLAELLNCADFFILGSKVETQCLAAIEAALCNIPIVIRKMGIFENLTSKDMKSIGYIGDDLSKGVSVVLKDRFNPRKIILKCNVHISESLLKWKKLVSQSKISDLVNQGGASILSILYRDLRAKYMIMKYELLGRDDVDWGEFGRFIIRHTPKRIYSIYRAIRYKK